MGDETLRSISGPRQRYDDDTTVNQIVMAMVMMTVMMVALIDRFGCVVKETKMIPPAFPSPTPRHLPGINAA